MKKYSLLAAILFSALITTQAAQLTGALRINTDTTGTNTKSSAITVTLQTNMNIGSIVISNVTASALVKVDANQKTLAATAGTDYSTPTSTDTFQNKTFNSQTTGNVLQFQDYKDFIYPHKIDGTGTTIITNEYTSGFGGLVKYAGTGGTNANYAFFRFGTVPLDIDTGTAMVLKNLGFVVSGTDTGSASFSVALFSPASSSVFTPSDFTACSTFINFTSGTLTSPVANDQFYFADVTLTGWAAALTAGRPLIIGIARDGTDANNDSITLTGGTILYGRIQ